MLFILLEAKIGKMETKQRWNQPCCRLEIGFFDLSRRGSRSRFQFSFFEVDVEVEVWKLSEARPRIEASSKPRLRGTSVKNVRGLGPRSRFRKKSIFPNFFRFYQFSSLKNRYLYYNETWNRFAWRRELRWLKSVHQELPWSLFTFKVQIQNPHFFPYMPRFQLEEHFFKNFDKWVTSTARAPIFL